MQFFKLDGIIVNEQVSEEQDDSRTRMNRDREKVWEINKKSRDYNQKLPGDMYFFVSDLSESTVTAGMISNDASSLAEQADSYLKGIGIMPKNTSLKEITLKSLRSLLQRADRQDYIEDEDEVLERFDLDKLYGRFCRGIDFEEELVEIYEKETAYAAAQRLLSNDTFLPELDRIYAGSRENRIQGHPVHYMIQTDDPEIRREMCDILLGALYANGRLRSRRYCILDVRPEQELSKPLCDCLYKSCIGGTVVVQYLACDDMENDQASYDRDVIELFCETMRKYTNQVLTVFCLPRECTQSRDMFYESMGNTSLIELKENFVYGEGTNDFLKMLAREYHIPTDDALFQMVEKEKGYLAPELHDLFDTWYSKKLKTEIYPQYREIASVKTEVREAKPKGSAYEELMGMVGLTEAKKVILHALDYHKAQKLFADKGFQADHPAMHMAFTGNPGTAKTTVARLFARIMKENGILSKGRLIEVGRGDLVGKYVGWTAPTIQKKFREAQGSVLFIDEAYSLVDDRSGSYGDEAINTIVQEMENHREDVIVIFAGYPKEMENFLQKNPGLRSRIAFHVPFEDYDTDELCKIAGLIAQEKGLALADDALEKLTEVFEEAKEDADFGNGRCVRNVIEKAKMAQAARLLKMDPESIRRQDVRTIRAEDIEIPARGHAKTKRIGFGD